MLKEAVVAYFKVLPQSFSERTEEVRENFCQYNWSMVGT
jgi:hypothetical protein